MFEPLQFPAPMESKVRFIEETPPDQIVEATLKELRTGTSPAELLAASALAVTRSTDLPADHHGGPIHPVAGVFAVYETARRLRDDWALMPVLHNVALSNKHIHSPAMGPAIMPKIEPRDSVRGPEATSEAFVAAIRDLKPNSAEQFLLALLERKKPGEVLDLMLRAAIRRNALDDHYFLYPVFAARALDCIGWEWAPVLLRKVVRYLATNARSLPNPEAGFNVNYVRRNVAAYSGFDEVENLLDSHRLLDNDIRQKTGNDESEIIGELGQHIGALDEYAGIPEKLAQALTDGLSLDGAGEALSIAAGMILLRTDYGNPFDVHLHTDVNARRYILGIDGVSQRNKILALLGWATGPEVRLSENKMVWPVRPERSSTAPSAPSQEGLLESVTESITERNSRSFFEAADNHVEQMLAGPGIQKTIGLARQYADSGYDPGAFFERMGELVCLDDFSEMHAFKGQQVVFEEYENTREPYRWVHLVSAAKIAACSHGMGQSIYQQARHHLAI